LFALFALAASNDDMMLSAALNSPRQMVSLYSSFEKSHGRHYEPAEERMRLKIFQKSVQEVAELNSKHNWHSVINDFSDKTEEEKRSYLGLNISRAMSPPSLTPRLTSSNLAAPASKSWIKEGAVTEVKNQGSCGSCWAFGALGSLEGQYKSLTGVLRQMSEENVLDCTYPGGNGCNGGWMKDGINFIKNNKNKLASMADYPYQGSDGTCDTSNTNNVIKGAVIDQYIELSTTSNLNEMTTINALAQGPLSVTIKVISSFYSYDGKNGDIYDDSTMAGFPNHALTAVAYTSKYILIKNSWGKSWGDDGYIKVARNWYGCAMHMYVGYPSLSKSGITDYSPSDPVTHYTGEDDDGGDEDKDCKDVVGNCPLLAPYCGMDRIKGSCAKSCGACTDDNDGSCPGGTTRCSDGVCRHIHMC